MTPTAWKMYKYSLLYLALLFVAMGVDRGLPFAPTAPAGAIRPGGRVAILAAAGPADAETPRQRAGDDAPPPLRSPAAASPSSPRHADAALAARPALPRPASRSLIALLLSAAIGLAFPLVVGYLLDAAFVQHDRALLDRIALGLIGALRRRRPCSTTSRPTS